MQTINPRKRERLRQKITLLVKQFSPQNEEQAVALFVDIMDDVETDLDELKESKASAHDIALLIQEMRAGFALMEKRFEAIDKRFEAIDKRFEDLIHYMDKRFEDMNKRFALLQWFMVIGFSMLAILISALKFFA